jgi:hypothetical protein
MRFTSVEGPEEPRKVPWPTGTRTLPVVRAHRMGTRTDPPYGLDDLPIKITGEYCSTKDGTVTEWHARASVYELEVMMKWGNYKAMLGMFMEQYIVDGLGMREALALAKENPGL